MEQFFFSEVVWLGFLVSGTWGHTKENGGGGSSELAGQVSSLAQVTAKSLLTVPRDAIVHMNADIALSAPAPKPAATISLREATLEGRSFTDSRMPADGERVKKRAQKFRATATRTGSEHTRRRR